MSLFLYIIKSTITIHRRKNDYKIGDGEWYDESSSTTFQDHNRYPVSSRHSCKKHISKYHQRKSNKSMLFYVYKMYINYNMFVIIYIKYNII